MSSSNGKSQAALAPTSGTRPTRSPVKSIAAATPASQRALAKAPPKQVTKPRRSPKTQKEQEMADRRKKAWAFRKRGWTYERIADELNVSWMTVKRDLDMMQQEIQESTIDFDVQGFVTEDVAEYDDLIASGWEQYEKGANVHQRVKALDFIRMTKGDRFKVLKEAGIIQGKPVEVEHKVTAAVIHGWSDEVRKAASRAILESMMGSTPLDPIPEEPLLKEPENVIDVDVSEEEDAGSDVSESE